jgi:hypothetical protein
VADELTDPRPAAPACPFRGCGAQAGDLWCYTPTGFRRHWHACRRAAAQGTPVTDGKPTPGRPVGRPTHKQADILAWAINNGGEYEVSGYTFRGDAQKRAAMRAMTDASRGWFEQVRHTDHGTLYKITDAGLAASARYENWLNGGK